MTLQLLQTFTDTEQTKWTCSWSSDGKVLAVSGADRIIRLYTPSCTSRISFVLSNELRGAHEKAIRYISFCPRRMQLAAASFDGTVSIWSGSTSTNKWTCTATLEGHENEVKSAGWATFLDSNAEEEETFLATCGRDKAVWVWAVTDLMSDEPDFECLAVLQEHEQDIKCLAWHPLQPIFLTGSYDESIRVWGPTNSSLDDWIPLDKLVDKLDGTVWSIAFSPNGRYCAVALSTGSIILYSIPENWNSVSDWIRKDIQIFDIIHLSLKLRDACNDGEGCCGSNSNISDNHNDSSCCSSTHSASQFDEMNPSDEYSGCCGGSNDKSNNQTEESTCCKQSSKPTSYSSIPAAEIYSVSWSSDSKYIALASSDHSIKIIESSTSVIIESVQNAHSDEVNAVSWSPIHGEYLLASVGEEGSLKIWKFFN